MRLRMALTLEELVKASEKALWFAVNDSNRQRAAAAVQVTSDFRLLELWRSGHRALLHPVAEATGRFGQPAELRASAVTLIERCALVDYLREYGIDPTARDVLLSKLRGVAASRNSLLAEHRNYVLALSSLICFDRLLDTVGDLSGPRLLQHYRYEYLGLFAQSCNQLLAEQASRQIMRPVELSTEIRDLKRVLTHAHEAALSN